MTLLPESFLTKIHREAAQGARTHLSHILELRGYITEGEAEGREVVAQMKREAAGALMVSLFSVERSLWIVKDYPELDLRRWLDNGFGMSHVETANRVYQMDGWPSPAELIEDAIERGGGDGKPMTCSEFWDFATGNAERPQKEVKLIRLFSSVLKISGRASVLLGWGEAKRTEFERELQSLWTRFTKG